MTEVSYSTDFFDDMEGGNLSSARTVVPIVLSLCNAKSVVDIGCGEALWLKAFTEAGVKDIHGVDGSWVEKNRLHIPPEYFTVADLEKPVVLDKRYDLAVCLEVAEHLAASAADTLVESLTSAAPVILFSAAIPLQGGTHHINEQWPAYWAEKFAARGFVPVDAIRWHIWDDARVTIFYQQNLLMYVKESELAHYPRLQAEIEHGHGKALSLVHPFLFTYYGERWRSIVPLLGKLPPSLLHTIKRLLLRRK